MKNQASTFLKHVLSVVATVVKVKSIAAKSKTSITKSRFLIFSLFHNKKALFNTISQKIHALMGDQGKAGEGIPSTEDYCKAIIMYNDAKNKAVSEDTDSVFALEDSDRDWIGNTTESVIDLAKNSHEGSEFALEDEIDCMADVYIKRFHEQMRMQKQESFKRYQEMMGGNV